MLFSAFTVFANFTLELFFLIKVHQAFLLCKDQVLRSVLIENHSVIPFEICRKVFVFEAELCACEIYCL